MNNPILSKQFYIDPFPVDFNIIVPYDENSYKDYCNNQSIPLNENSIPNDSSAFVYCKESSVYIILYLSNLYEIGVIAHESIHAVDKMFQVIDQPEHTITGDELIPYYTQYIVNQIIEFLIENNLLSITFNKIEENEK